MRFFNFAPAPLFNLLLSALLLLITVGCSGGGSSAPAPGTPPGEPTYGRDESGAAYLGAANCLGCHEQQTPAAAASYLASRHAIPGTVDAAAGECLNCHDPLGDGARLAPWFDPAAIPAAGMSAVGCENCHGAGPHHLTMIPDHPNPAPDYLVCGQCHKALPPGVAAHGAGLADNILGQYLASNHALSDWAFITFPFCARCHSDQGFRLHGLATLGLDSSQIQLELAGADHLENPSQIQCRTCHHGHSGELRTPETVAVEGTLEVVKYSRQFNLCTTCHQVFLQAVYDPAEERYNYTLDTGRIPFHGALGADGYPLSGKQVIWDTHFASGDGFLLGFGINPASERACSICHDPHRALNFAAP